MITWTTVGALAERFAAGEFRGRAQLRGTLPFVLWRPSGLLSEVRKGGHPDGFDCYVVTIRRPTAGMGRCLLLSTREPFEPEATPIAFWTLEAERSAPGATVTERHDAMSLAAWKLRRARDD